MLVSQLVFQNNPLGLSIQIVVIIFRNFLTYTYGIMNSVSVNANATKALREFLKNPIFYALLLGLLCMHLSSYFSGSDSKECEFGPLLYTCLHKDGAGSFGRYGSVVCLYMYSLSSLRLCELHMRVYYL